MKISTTRLRVLCALAPVLGLAACAEPKVTDYAQEKPVLEMREYFNGPVTARGVFTDRAGRQVKRFVVTMQCKWEGENGTLDEQFQYSDGSHQRRVWHLTRTAEGHYTGQADDVVGVAQGESAGNTFHWRYTLALPVDGRVWDVQFDDWMYRIDEHSVLNRAVMSKLGLQLGEVTLAFTKD